MATSSDLRGAVVVADVLAGLIAALSALAFVFFRHIRTRFLGHDGGRGSRAAGAHGQQEIAPGEAPGALGHDCLLDLIVLPAKYASDSRAFQMPPVQARRSFSRSGRPTRRSWLSPNPLLHCTMGPWQAGSSG